MPVSDLTHSGFMHKNEKFLEETSETERKFRNKRKLPWRENRDLFGDTTDSEYKDDSDSAERNAIQGSNSYKSRSRKAGAEEKAQESRSVNEGDDCVQTIEKEVRFGFSSIKPGSVIADMQKHSSLVDAFLPVEDKTPKVAKAVISREGSLNNRESSTKDEQVLVPAPAFKPRLGRPKNVASNPKQRARVKRAEAAKRRQGYERAQSEANAKAVLQKARDERLERHRDNGTNITDMYHRPTKLLKFIPIPDASATQVELAERQKTSEATSEEVKSLEKTANHELSSNREEDPNQEEPPNQKEKENPVHEKNPNQEENPVREENPNHEQFTNQEPSTSGDLSINREQPIRFGQSAKQVPTYNHEGSSNSKSANELTVDKGDLNTESEMPLELGETSTSAQHLLCEVLSADSGPPPLDVVEVTGHSASPATAMSEKRHLGLATASTRSEDADNKIIEPMPLTDKALDSRATIGQGCDADEFERDMNEGIDRGQLQPTAMTEGSTLDASEQTPSSEMSQTEPEAIYWEYIVKRTNWRKDIDRGMAEWIVCGDYLFVEEANTAAKVELKRGRGVSVPYKDYVSIQKTKDPTRYGMMEFTAEYKDNECYHVCVDRALRVQGWNPRLREAAKSWLPSSTFVVIEKLNQQNRQIVHVFTIREMANEAAARRLARTFHDLSRYPSEAGSRSDEEVIKQYAQQLNCTGDLFNWSMERNAWDPLSVALAVWVEERPLEGPRN
ncbi:MAG: hypothetical protein M1833_003538 [Piccolia ochrophora]|nr:MAG: hypothetical protein M1833_003538 [Piccolia ochrophora]